VEVEERVVPVARPVDGDGQSVRGEAARQRVEGDALGGPPLVDEGQNGVDGGDDVTRQCCVEKGFHLRKLRRGLLAGHCS
jgi:hypothetical protein